MFKKIAILGVAILTGNWIANTFVIFDVDAKGQKVGMGFVANDPTSALGMDDLARAVTVAVVVYLAGRYLD